MTFPKPVGTARLTLTIHSELATLPGSFRAKGVHECSFRIAFPRAVLSRLQFLRSAGLLSDRPVRVGDTSVVPRDLLLTLLRSQPPGEGPRLDAQYEILRATVRGTRKGRSIQETVDCHTTAMTAWNIGTDINTGSPPSIVMQMLASGDITARGVLPPERAVPVEPFLRDLGTRGMTIRRSVHPWKNPRH